MIIIDFDEFWNHIFLEKRNKACSARTTLRMNEHEIHDIIVSILWYKMKRKSFYLLKVL